MPIQISGLPADILPEVKSMKNKKRIIAAVFTAASIVTGFMRWNFFIKPKPVTDIRFWQDFEGKINYKIGNEYSAWSDHPDYDVDDIINIVAEIKTGEKVTIDPTDYPGGNKNYMIGLFANRSQTHLTVRFYDDFKYVAFLDEMYFENYISEAAGAVDAYILENPDYIKSVFDDIRIYIPPRTVDRLQEYVKKSLSQMSAGQFQQIAPDFAEDYSGYDPETDSELKISIPEDTDIMFFMENRQPVQYSTAIIAKFKDTRVTLYLRVENGEDGYYVSYARIY